MSCSGPATRPVDPVPPDFNFDQVAKFKPIVPKQQLLKPQKQAANACMRSSVEPLMTEGYKIFARYHYSKVNTFEAVETAMLDINTYLRIENAGCDHPVVKVFFGLRNESHGADDVSYWLSATTRLLRRLDKANFESRMHEHIFVSQGISLLKSAERMESISATGVAFSYQDKLILADQIAYARLNVYRIPDGNLVVELDYEVAI